MAYGFQNIINGDEVAAEHSVDLSGEIQRTGKHRPRWPVHGNLAIGQNHNPVRYFGYRFNIVSGHDYCIAGLNVLPKEAA
jgi:hypothetical protein